MPRILLLTVALCAVTPTRAQDVGPDRQRPTTGQRVLLVTGAVAGGVLTAGLVGPFVPIPVAAATYGTSAALGLRPTVGGVVLDTAAGTVFGICVYAATVYYITEVEGHPHEFGVDITGFLAGVVVGSAATGAVHGVRLAMLRGPDGDRAPGLSIRLGL